MITGALGDAEDTVDQVRNVVAIMERHDTLARTIAQAHAHAGAARTALEAAPAGQMSALLADVVEFSVLRLF